MKSTPFLALIFCAPTLLAAPETAIQRAAQEAKQSLSDVQQAQQHRWLAQHSYQTAEKSTPQNEDLSQVCLPYSAVKFVGFSLIDPAPFAPEAGACLNEIRLNQLQTALTLAYLEKGYLHNPMRFEDDQSGVLFLRVQEGKVAKLSGENGFRAGQILPNALGKPLSVRDLDQALDQANRIAGNHVSVDVLPAQNGEIEVAFHNEKSRPLAGFVGLNNAASDSYNRWQWQAGLSVGNPFGVSDVLAVNVAHTLASATRFSRSALLYYSVPYGYWTFNAFGSVSQFKLPVQLASARFEQRGRTAQWGAGADWVVHRGENHISTLSAQVEQLDSKNRFAGAKLDLQSPRLTSGQLGFNHLQLFQNGNWTADLRGEWGRNRGENQPQKSYRKLNLALQLTRYQRLGEQLFRHSHQLTAQWSKDYLPAAKQEELTGRYRVRGFDRWSLAAEKNAVWQNTLAWVKTWGKAQISPYVGVDLGVQKSTLPASHSEKALGYALGVEWQRARWLANVEWAMGRLYTRENGVAQEKVLYASIRYQF